MIRRTRWLPVTLLSVAYVGWAALRHATDGRPRFLGLVIILSAFGFGWARAGALPEGGGHADPRVRSAVRGTLWGSALVAASLLGTPDRVGVLAAAVVGASAACATALLALSRVPPAGGLLDHPPSAGRIEGAYLCLGMGLLTALPPTLRVFGRATQALDDATVCSIATSGCLGQLILVAAMTRHWSKQRELEIGPHERLSAAWALSLSAVLVGATAALLAPAGSEPRVAAVADAVAALGICACVVARDPARVRILQRLFLGVFAVGAPVGAAFASVSFRAPDAAPAATGLAMACGILVGVLAAPMARKLDAVAAKTLQALHKAQVQAQRLDPDDALTGALMALRELSGTAAASAELWCTDPPALITVDRAGYAHHTPCVAPPTELFALVQLEPERTLQSAVVERMEVRRPDIRPSGAWLDQREAFTATVVDDGQFVLGLLLLPTLGRHLPLTLEEARALRLLADRLASILSARSALSRSRSRELSTREQADRLENRVRELESAKGSRVARHKVVARHLARPAMIANYSSTALAAQDEIRTLACNAERILMLTPPGLDPAPFAAAMHLHGPRAAEPIIVVDAVELPEVSVPASPGNHHEVESRDSGLAPIDDAQDPVRAAGGGSLLVLGSAALTRGQQRTLWANLERMRSETQTVPVTILSVPVPVADLVADGRFSEEFAASFGDRTVALPPLAARPEDLRGILLDRVAKVGMKLRGRPLGLDPGALERLIEHSWPGNDVEMEDVLTRAALSTPRDVVSTAVLDQIGFLPLEWSASEPRIARSGGARAT